MLSCVKIFVLSGVLLLMFSSSTFAASENPGFFPLEKASKYGDLPDTVTNSATGGANTLVSKIAENVKYLIGAIAIALITFSGFKIAVSYGEDVLAEDKKNLLYGLVGLLLISIGMPLSEIFGFQNGGAFNNTYELTERLGLFNNQTVIIITFIKYILGSIAVLMIVINGAQLITDLKGEGGLDSVKKRLGASVAGLVLVMFSGTLINKVLYKVDLDQAARMTGVDPTIDPDSAIAEIVGITNLAVTFLGPILVLIFIVCGIYYVVSFQDESHQENAKKWMKNIVIGLVIIYGAFAIVSTFIAGNVDGVG